MKDFVLKFPEVTFYKCQSKFSEHQLVTICHRTVHSDGYLICFPRCFRLRIFTFIYIFYLILFENTFLKYPCLSVSDYLKSQSQGWAYIFLFFFSSSSPSFDASVCDTISHPFCFPTLFFCKKTQFFFPIAYMTILHLTR